MGSISDYLEDEFLDHILKTDAGFSPAATLYVGLSTADPTDSDGGIAEPGDTYTREAITFSAAATRAIIQNGAIEFPEANGSWGTVTHWFICDHETNTTWGTNVNMYAHGALSAGKAIVDGNTPSIADTEVQVSVDATGMSDYLANAFLNWAFRAQALAQPTSLWVGLVEGSAGIADADTGSTVDELDFSTYARVQEDNWSASAAGATDNDDLIDFGVLDGASGETIDGIGLFDASTVGQLLFYDNTVNQVVNAGDSVNIPAGDFNISIS